MAKYKHSSSPVFKRFFQPVVDAHPHADRGYDCTNLTDLDFIEAVSARCSSELRSGRGFLQRHGDQERKDITNDLFFKSIKSARRLENLRSVNQLLAAAMVQRCADPFAGIEELDGFSIYAGDGHFHQASTQDPKSISSAGVEAKRATGHFYMLDLRTHFASLLATAQRGGRRKGEHDMHAIKRSGIAALRGQARKGRKVIVAWDRAGIDFAFWHQAKHNGGLYFISMEKENMNLMKSGDRPFDRGDRRNAGVVADELVSPGSGGHMLRRVIYIDPLTGVQYNYLTTEMTLPPWAIVLIYKQRWDIEKVFDEFKNKFGEGKSWSKDPVGKETQALALCLTHNLCILLEEWLRREEGVGNVAEGKRKKRREKEDRMNGGNFITTAIQRFTVRSVKFIRWLNAFIYREAPWGQAVARLTRIYARL